jgi:FKBP-type peptidyl-prolyl cis-trans isomerase SlyD
MQITKNAVASIEYQLSDDAGEVIDSSAGGAPLAYLHGNGNLIPGLETELEGKASGDSFKVRIAPENAYGVRHEALIQDVPRSQFPEGADIQPGMQFQAGTEAGMQVVTVVGVEGDQVKLDGNHPLAGVHLNFEVTVVEVREATAEELEHGHVHGPGGHQH